MDGTVRVDGGEITTITLDRPDRGNALSTSMLETFFDALGSVAGTETRCIVLRGEGKHFCAGADVGDVASSAAGGARYGLGFERLLRTIEEHPIPVVARVHGAALGAGCQLLAACDLSVAATDAQIGIPSAKLGLLLDLEKIQRMVRVIGVAHSRELLLAGRSITGTRAASWGLVTLAVDAGDLDDAVAELARSVAAGAPFSVRGSKAALRSILDYGALTREVDGEIFALHDAAAGEALASEDIREGMAALRERRDPRFSGK
ncbi:MAG: enoyl-CoA hydratase/isomerase family protein [Actinomycetota bacterium]|nr:enoyl-CoA hydratase/isomerase family protein [Actinomycetota bacterium]